MTKYFHIVVDNGNTQPDVFVVDENWRIKHDAEGRLTVVGDLLQVSSKLSAEDLGVWRSHIACRRFIVEDANETCIKLYQSAVDIRKAEELVDYIRSLTCELLDDNLPDSVKDIIKRTPAAFDQFVGAVGDGLTVLREKIQTRNK